MFQKAQSIAEEQQHLSKLAGLIHKYTQNNRASINMYILTKKNSVNKLPMYP